ncbi:unnamed protein product [Heligmosomoides polygyrus]|uniref:ShKT domain-containing protein n=1 Tax=Heligmosomoides polygyrus TaxID=6339 RepID=A0A183FHD7_HELPZ|nr:unnamed protein product [Heligmosomoides polygyrus]
MCRRTCKSCSQDSTDSFCLQFRKQFLSFCEKEGLRSVDDEGTHSTVIGLSQRGRLQLLAVLLTAIQLPGAVKGPVQSSQFANCTAPVHGGSFELGLTWEDLKFAASLITLPCAPGRHPKWVTRRALSSGTTEGNAAQLLLIAELPQILWTPSVDGRGVEVTVLFFPILHCFG